jgi:formylmethanofuran dehydrogenase subunit E-like metal-binding protein
MALYTCPKCLYETGHLCRIESHFARLRPCKLQKGGVLLTDEIKASVLCKSYVVEEKTKKEMPNITYQYINNGSINILTNRDLVTATVPFIHDLVSKSTIFERLDDLNHEEIDESHIYKMTKCITHTQDQTNLADAFYSYDVVNKNYTKRMDRCGHNWIWKICTFEEIFTDIIEQIRKRVFIPYEISLNNEFASETIDVSKLHEFYKISQYLLIKPLCCEAKHDNQLLHKRSDVEYFEWAVSDLRDTLCDIFYATHIDVWEMATFRNNIKKLIETNADTTFKKIKDLICRSLLGNIVV